MKISIIIPIYKVEAYLCECVDSVLAQTYKDIEIILVDDGSPDRCPTICDEYGQKDTRVKIIHKQNGGLSDARNFGFKECTGEYVVFLDADDWWIGKNTLEKVVTFLVQNPDILFFDRVTYCDNGQVIYPKGMSLSNINGKPLTEAVEMLLNNSKFIVSACNKFVKTSLLKENGIEFQKGLVCEDIDWTFQILEHAKSLYGYDKPFYGYRKRSGSITATIGLKNIKDLLYIIEKWSERMLNQDNDERLRYQLLGELNYQYCIVNGFLTRLSIIERNEVVARVKALEWLLKYDVNKKTHLASRLYKIAGPTVTRYILNKYIILKNKGFKIQ